MSSFSVSAPVLAWREGEPFSEAYGDIYFSRNDGLEESRHIFLHNSQLPARWLKQKSFCIAETGFGTGLNFLAVLEAWHETRHDTGHLYYISVEQHPLNRQDLCRAVAHWPQLAHVSAELMRVYPDQLTPGWHCFSLFDGAVSLMLGLGDAVAMYSQLEMSVDAWFLDGFAPGKNPAMWSEGLFAQVGRLSHLGTSVATFTVAGVVRRGLQQQGFVLRKPAGFGGKRENLCGELQNLSTTDVELPWFSLTKAVASTSAKLAVVVGGGIAGVTTAYALRQRGMQVVLLERESQLAQAGSGNRAGLVLPKLTAQPDAIGRFYLQAFLHTVRWLDELKVEDDALPWHKTGVLMRVDSARFNRAPEWLQQCGVLEEADVADYPGLAKCDDSLLLCRAAGWLNPAGLVKALLDRTPDIRVFTSTQLSDLRRDGDRWRLQTSTGEMVADVVVLANAGGAMALDICRELPMFRNLGQLAYLQDSRQLQLPVSAKGYVIPNVAGQWVLGASYEHDLTHDDPQEQHRQTLRQHWRQLLALPLPEESWIDRVGERVTTRDHLPLVGPMVEPAAFKQQFAGLRQGKTARYFTPCEYLPGLYLNLAHGSRGLVTAHYAAQYLAHLIADGRVIWSTQNSQLLHPARFLVRELRKPFK